MSLADLSSSVVRAVPAGAIGRARDETMKRRAGARGGDPAQWRRHQPVRDGAGWAAAARAPLWPAPCAGRLPVVCLPGLARTAADFRCCWPTALANDAAAPRPCWRSTSAATAAPTTIATRATTRCPSRSTTVVAVLTALEERAGRAGRHLARRPRRDDAGGAAADGRRRRRPQRHRPGDRAQGLMRIKSYVGKMPTPRNYQEGADILRRLFGAQFPKLERAGLDRGSRTAPGRSSDGALVSTMTSSSPARLRRPISSGRCRRCGISSTRWRAYPLMVVRGANSDVLAASTLEAMLARRGAHRHRRWWRTRATRRSSPSPS